VALLALIDRLRHLLDRRNPSHALGRRGEDLAQRYLQRQGYRILARNWRGQPRAEVDIVALDGVCTVFVEVKSLASAAGCSPERMVSELKRVEQRICARAWARRAGIAPEQVRFDLVTVVFDDPPVIEHIIDAWGRRGVTR
jgi:putative endonuclease